MSKRTGKWANYGRRILNVPRQQFNAAPLEDQETFVQELRTKVLSELAGISHMLNACGMSSFDAPCLAQPQDWPGSR